MSRGSVLGWIVLRRDTTASRWALDFDGEVHTSRPRADEALGLAIDAGHQAVLAEAVWLPDAPLTTEQTEALTAARAAWDPADRCNPATGHHSMPHKGCILR